MLYADDDVIQQVRVERRVDLPMWDDEINEAVHQETTGSLCGDFKARVLARIEADIRRREPDRWRFAWLAPIAVAAILLIALTINRTHRESPTPMTMTGDIPLASDPIAPAPYVVAELARPTRDPARPAVAAAPSSVTTIFEPAADDPTAIAIAPLSIASIEVDAMETIEPAIPLLTVDAIEVPALDQ